MQGILPSFLEFCRLNVGNCRATLIGLAAAFVTTSLAACSEGPLSERPAQLTQAPAATPSAAPTPVPTDTPITGRMPTSTSKAQHEPIPTVVVGRPEDTEGDVAVLLDGVAEIGAPGVPGALCIYGSEAFPVIVGAVGDFRAPVVAAGRWQAGRIVALGHDGYFTRSALQSTDTGRLIQNALHWSAGGEPSGLRIGVVGAAELRTWLKEAGHDVVEVSLTHDSLGTVDVVAVVVWNHKSRELDALSKFVRDGGGLVTAVTGWGWAQLHPHLDLANDYAGNRLLANVGVHWSHDYLGRTSPEGYAIDGSPPGLTHAGTALESVEAHANGRRTLTQPEINQASDSLLRAARCVPEDDSHLVQLLERLIGRDERDIRWPSAEHPVGQGDVIARLAAALFVLEQSRTQAESVRAHPMAADFPGSVPDDAPRITRSVTIDAAIPRWHSTGLYAAAGELVTVTVPAEVAETGNFHVRVGAHKDRVWHRSEWTRMPQICRRFPITATQTLVASAFGGLIYIEVPADSASGSVTIEIEGAVAAPLFVLGKTDPDTWRNEIRHAPAPWAEIAGRNMIVTTRSSEVRNLDDPATVAKTWDQALDLSAELASWTSLERSSPERFVVDRQLSAGYMHSGYPIMAHLDQQDNLVDAEHLRSECNWGFYHEVGHNHQADDWTFDGTVEVTVNLFTIYIYEFLCGIPRTQNEHPSDRRDRAVEMSLYDFDDPDFEQWKREPFLALIMYEQLLWEFGWDAYRAVFATYRALPEAERPKTDDEKRDQWMVRFSRQVGRNLGPFFEAWGVPTSQQARRSIADLPVWLPTGFPPRR